MSVVPLIGHEEQRERFRLAFSRRKLATSFLFVGIPGIGKRQFANWLAQGLLCAAYREAMGSEQADAASAHDRLDPCGECRSCKMFLAETHPDMHTVVKPPERAELPLELLIGDREHRMREGLCADLAIKPAIGQRKVAIIDDADSLNEAGANSLLKTLEEPPRGSILILIGGSEHRQLPTIRSRCQIVRFQPLSLEQLSAVAQTMSLEASSEAIAAAAAQSGGSIQQLVDWLEPQLHEFRNQLLGHLQSLETTDHGFGKVLQQFVEEAGTDARSRRRRLDRVIDLTIEHYRRWMQSSTQAPVGPVWNARASDAIEVCLAAQSALHANAHIPTLIDGWLIELGQVLRGETLIEDSFARA